MYPQMGLWWKKGSMCKKQGSFPWSNPGLLIFSLYTQVSRNVHELCYLFLIIISDKVTTVHPDPIRNFIFSQIKKFNKKKHEEQDYS